MSLEDVIIALTTELKRYNDRNETARISLDGSTTTKVETPKAEKPATKAAPAKAAAEAGKAIEAEAPTPGGKDSPFTEADMKTAVTALVNAGNKSAGNDKAGREIAFGVLQPYGAKNVSTIKPEDYAKVHAALTVKLAEVTAAAELAG